MVEITQKRPVVQPLLTAEEAAAGWKVGKIVVIRSKDSPDDLAVEIWTQKGQLIWRAEDTIRPGAKYTLELPK